MNILLYIIAYFIVGILVSGLHARFVPLLDDEAALNDRHFILGILAIIWPLYVMGCTFLGTIALLGLIASTLSGSAALKPTQMKVRPKE